MSSSIYNVLQVGEVASLIREKSFTGQSYKFSIRKAVQVALRILSDKNLLNLDPHESLVLHNIVNELLCVSWNFIQEEVAHVKKYDPGFKSFLTEDLKSFIETNITTF